MRKFLNLFLLMMFVCLGANLALAGSHNVTMMVNDASNLRIRHAAFSTTGMNAGTAVSGIQAGVHEYTVGNDYLMIGFEDKSAPAAVYLNGSKQSTTTSGSKLTGGVYTFYRITLSGSPIMIEIYPTSDANKYEYDLDVDINDDSNHVTLFKNTGSNSTYEKNKDGLYTGVKFKYGDSFTVNTDKESTSYSLSGLNTTVNKSGNNYTFTPFPGSTHPKFSLVIPGDNVVYNLSATADDSSMILGYKINGVATNDLSFKANQPIKIYTAYEPVSYYGISNLSFVPDNYNGTSCYSTTFNGPEDNVNLNMTFNGSFTSSINGQQHIYSYTATDVFGNSREVAKNGVETFHKGDIFKLYSKYVPTSCEPDLAWSSSNYNGTPCYMATFAPTNEGTLNMSFTGGDFNVQIQDDEDKVAELLEEYYAGFQVIHDDNTVEDLVNETTNNNSFSAFGSFRTKFSLGDTYVLYLKAVPESILFDGSEMEYTEQEMGGETYIVYTFTPTADGRISLTFGSPTAPGPIVEETFKVYIKADRANVVNAQVRTTSGNTDIVIGDSYTEVECPVSGYIYCTILDESMYSFLSFMNTDENVDFLDYDPPTTYPVTIRQTRATSDTDMITNTGDHFDITTKSKANLQWYSLTLNIVDDASNVQVEVGTSNQAKSQANRSVGNLQVGDNTINFSEEDTYLVVSSKNFRSLYEVTFDKATVTKTEAWPAEFYMSLSANAANGHVVITANEPIEEGDKEFTLTIDHPELVVMVRRFVGGSMSSYEDVDLTGLVAGANTLKFADGDEFRIQLSDDYPVQYVRQNSTNISDWNGLYDFYPAEDDNVVVYFGELPTLPTFTVVTDRPDMVTELYNYTRGKGYSITEEFTTLEFFAGNEFHIRLGSLDPKYVTLNDAAVEKNGEFYQFTPTDGATLKIIFSKVPTRVPTFTLTVDDASHLTEIGDDESESEDPLFDSFVNGENTVPVGSGSLTLYVDGEATLVTVDGTPVEVSKKGKNYWYELSVSEGSVVFVKFEKDPTFTLIVDDPAKMLGFSEEANVGSNSYTFTTGQNFSFSVAENSVPVCAKIGDNAIVPVDGVYSFAPADGDVVKVFFNYEPECTGNLYTVKATFVNEGSEDIVNWVYVDDREMALDGFLSGNVLVDAETSISFNYKNYDYIVNSITVNGSTRNNTGAISFIVNSNSEVVFDVRKPTVINYTIVVDNPAEIEAYYPDSAHQSGMIPVEFKTQLDENDNAIEGNEYHFVTNELHPVIVIKKVAGVEAIISVDNNNVAVEANDFDQFVINLTDGDVIAINSDAVVYDETFVVIVDINTENCIYEHNEAFLGIENTGTLTGIKSNRSIALVPGRNEVKFNSAYDGAFLLGYSKMPSTLHTYVDAVEISTDPMRLDMFYVIEAQEGTLVRSTYYASAEVVTEVITSEIEDEETHEITYQEVTVTVEKDVTPEPFEIDLAIDESIQDDILVLRDIYQVIYDINNFVTTSNEPVNTLYSVFIRESKNVYLYLYRAEEFGQTFMRYAAPAKNSEASYADTEILRVDDIDPANVPDGYKHVCSFYVNQPMVLTMDKSDVTTGVENIVNSVNGTTDIYNLQGIKIKANASAADFKELPAGIYVYGGRKILVK